MDDWTVRIILAWWLLIVCVSWPLVAWWGARVWAQYARDHSWYWSTQGPVPDLRNFLRAVQYYYGTKRNEGKF